MSLELQSKLREARAKLGITQADFASRLGVPPPTYKKWENDQRTPRGLALTALNAALDKILKK